MRKDIDPKQIGLIGHSEGGMIAPIATTRSQGSDNESIVRIQKNQAKNWKILL